MLSAECGILTWLGHYDQYNIPAYRVVFVGSCMAESDTTSPLTFHQHSTQNCDLFLWCWIVCVAALHWQEIFWCKNVICLCKFLHFVHNGKWHWYHMGVWRPTIAAPRQRHITVCQSQQTQLFAISIFISTFSCYTLNRNPPKQKYPICSIFQLAARLSLTILPAGTFHQLESECCHSC